MNVTLVCEDSFDGIMTAIYDGWVLMNKGNQVFIHPGRNYAPTFFSEFIFIDTDMEKAVKVAASIRVKISVEAYSMVFKACMHYSEERANAVFEFLKIAYPAGAKVVKMLGNPAVIQVMELSRKASNEAHSFKEFIRFKELRGNVLYGKIEPRCDVLPLISLHFENRFPEENWIIYDEKRIKAAVHPKMSETIVLEGKDMEELTRQMQKDDGYDELWNIFFNTIGIDARYNPKCQRNFLPKWYRKNMVEFQAMPTDKQK